MYSFSKFEHDRKKSAFKYREPVSQDYQVFVNGEEVPVYTCRISKIPFNRPWPGHQREINQTETASFVNIVSDEEIKLEVRVNKKYGRVMIRPYSKDIKYTDIDGKVSFSLKENGQYVFACDDLHGCLFIFNSKPVEAPDPDSVTYYFGPGVHMPGKIALKNNESIYADKDALIFGTVFAENAENIRIFGNGLFDGSFEERICIHCYEDYTNGNIKFYDCRNISVEGVLFRNSAIWCVNLFHCFDAVIDNIKVFGQWRYNTDGVDIVNCQNITVKNSFIHSFDDAVTIKGIDRYITTDNKNILTENCVLWCDWGKTCEIGLETACREYKNIIFRGCDIIRAGNTALDIQNGDCAEVSDVVYENINVEYNSFDNVPVIQENDDCTYDKYNEPFIPRLISIENYRFRETYSNDTWGVPGETAPLDLEGIRYAAVHDVVIKNIKVYCDGEIPVKDGKYNLPVVVRSAVAGTRFFDISVSDVTANGVCLNAENTVTELSETDGFRFI